MEYYLIASLSTIFGMLIGLIIPRKNDSLVILKEELANKQVLINQFADLTAQLYTVQHQEQTPVALSVPGPLPAAEAEVQEEINTMFAGETGGQN